MGQIEWTIHSSSIRIKPGRWGDVIRLERQLNRIKKIRLWVFVLTTFSFAFFDTLGIFTNFEFFFLFFVLTPQFIIWIEISGVKRDLRQCHELVETARTYQSRGGGGWWKW